MDYLRKRFQGLFWVIQVLLLRDDYMGRAVDFIGLRVIEKVERYLQLIGELDLRLVDGAGAPFRARATQASGLEPTLARRGDRLHVVGIVGQLAAENVTHFESADQP